MNSAYWPGAVPPRAFKTCQSGATWGECGVHAGNGMFSSLKNSFQIMAEWDCEGDKHADKLCPAVWAAGPRWSAERAERGGAGLVSFHMVGFSATSLKMTPEMVCEWEIKSQLKGSSSSSSRRSPCTQSCFTLWSADLQCLIITFHSCNSQFHFCDKCNLQH